MKKGTITFPDRMMRYSELSDEQAEKAFEKFMVGYREVVEDYMREFYFDREGDCYKIENNKFIKC